MVDYVSVLEKHYPEVGFGLEDNSYNSIQFEYGEVPSKEHLDKLWTEMELDVIREKRNKLLKESDFRVVADYPQRDKWIVYRQALRDYPSIWLPDRPFPETPE
jgi:hypothetical protein